MQIAEDPPSPPGRGQGEGLKIQIDLRPSPGASRRPLPEGEGQKRLLRSDHPPTPSAQTLLLREGGNWYISFLRSL